MFKWYFIVFFTYTGVLFTGCGKNTYTEEIETLDSLKTQILAAQTVFKASDSSVLVTINRKVFDDLRYVQRNYKPDSIEFDRAELINAYKGIRKECAKYLMVRSRMNTNFPYTIKQLDDLLFDLKEQTLGSDEVEKYMDTEKKAALTLLGAFTMYNTGVPALKVKYDSLQPKIDRFITEIKADTLQ